MSAIDVKNITTPNNFDLTINTVGSGTDIIFKSNGTQTAKIDQAGNLTLTGTVDGVDIQTLNTAVTANTAKTGITSSQATAITAALPKAGGTMTGTLAFSGGNISHASHLTIDVVGNINLDSDGGLVRIQDNGNDIAAFEHGGAGLFAISTLENNADMVFKGKDGGSVIEALKFDMSDAGYATFNTGAHFKNATMIAYNSDPTLVLRRTGNAAGNGSIDFQGNDGSVDYSITAAGSTAGTLQFSTATSNAMTINSNGYVGIGTTAPQRLLHISNTTSGQTTGIRMTGANNGSQVIEFADTDDTNVGYIQYDHGLNKFTFRANDTATMTIGLNSRSFIGHEVGTFSASGASKGLAVSIENNIIASHYSAQISGAVYVHRFYNTNGQCGYIQINGSSVTFNTGSDYRLKENVDYDWDATTRLKQLKPARFNFIADDTTIVDGFIAHEVSSIVPEAVSGDKDGLDSEGDPEYQGIDQSKLVPLLVKTIQELEARLTAGGL